MWITFGGHVEPRVTLQTLRKFELPDSFRIPFILRMLAGLRLHLNMSGGESQPKKRKMTHNSDKVLIPHLINRNIIN